MYQIEKDVPMPKGRAIAYPFEQMKVGDSFSFDEKDRNNIAGSISYYQRKNAGVRFAVRKQGDGKCRVWRVA